jgi:ubiquinone/menaquinone biosynthesis C-methylase UbiE
MKLSNRLKPKITEQLILRINELYHDFENRLYNQRHPNLFQLETNRWNKIAVKYIWKDTPVTCLDYGTGTGFVPKIIGLGLKSSDKLICTDLSQEMLNVCEKDLKMLSLDCETTFLKSNGKNIAVPDGSVDILTINSVLHHLPDISEFFKESSRVLKHNGLLIIVHEPNGDTELPIKYKILINTLSAIFYPQNFIFKIAEKNKIAEVFFRKLLNFVSHSYKERNKLLNNISEILLKENLIDVRLRGVEVQQIVDIQTEFGFLKEYLLSKISSHFELVEWNTFNFIDLRSKKITNKTNNFFEAKFPEKGHTMSIILKKR